MKTCMKKLFDLILGQRFIFRFFFMVILELESSINHDTIHDLTFKLFQNVFILFVFISVFNIVGIFFHIVLFMVISYLVYDLLITLTSLFMKLTGTRIHRDFVNYLYDIYMDK